MTPEEQTAADAAAKVAGSAGSADAGAETMSRAEVQKIIADRDAAKAKVKELTPLADAGKKALDASKTAEERLAALTIERDTFKGQAEEAASAMTARLAMEVAAIPEALRGLVPAGLSPAKQLEWIGSAQAAGLFGQKSTSPGAQIPGANGGATVTQTEFVRASESRRVVMRQQVAEGKLTVIAG